MQYILEDSQIDDLWSDFQDNSSANTEIINNFLIDEDTDEINYSTNTSSNYSNNSNNSCDTSDNSDNSDSNESIDSGDSNESNDSNVETECIEDILKKDPTRISSIDIIHAECSIAYFVQVFIENISNNSNQVKLSYDELDDVIIYLEWISRGSEILANRIGQELFIPSAGGDIVRSSYSFCSKYTQCSDFYNIDEKPICVEHHYVHSLLKYDVDSVILYLKTVKNTSRMEYIIADNQYDNLHSSIKTICFVTRHMAKEIGFIDYMSKYNGDAFHRNNPFDTKKKKNMINRINDNTSVSNFTNKFISNTFQKPNVKNINHGSQSKTSKIDNNIYSILNE